VIVVDASVIIELLLRTPAADAIVERLTRADESLHAPHLIDVEVAQVIRRYVIRDELDSASAEALVELLKDLPIRRYSHQPLLPRMWQLRENMTAYDAAYLALAEGLSATLVTRDRALAQVPNVRATVEVL
jgi:predicted nucleic acid-binding protein